MNIIKPSPEEKEKAIEYILSKGLSKPKNLWDIFYMMYRSLGFRYLFLDTTGPIIISVAFMIGFILLCSSLLKQYINAVLFATAPVFFVFAVLLTEIAERVNLLYELKMTCKYTILQITAFRVVCFSLIGTVLCTLISLFAPFPGDYDIVRALSLSLCALFLCSSLSIFIMRYFNWKWSYFAPIMAWTAICLLPFCISVNWWDSFLSRVPVAITISVAAAALVLFLKEIKKFVNIQIREVWYYVGS
jgi:hypothetical protein